VSHLGEDAEAFFKKGDEGTYEGGPRSIMPSSRDCPEPAEEDESLTTELIAGQLERRSRMQRLVTKIVGGLGVGVLLLVPVRLRASSAAGVAAPKPGAAITPAPPAATLEPVLSVPAPIATAPVTTAHAATEAPSDTADAIGVRAASEARRPHGTAVHSQQQGNRRAARMTRPTRTLAPTPPSSGRRFPDSHAPPTAIFPD
jgi:hypothetical protein